MLYAELDQISYTEYSFKDKSWKSIRTVELNSSTHLRRYINEWENTVKGFKRKIVSLVFFESLLRHSSPIKDSRTSAIVKEMNVCAVLFISIHAKR